MFLSGINFDEVTICLKTSLAIGDPLSEKFFKIKFFILTQLRNLDEYDLYSAVHVVQGTMLLSQ
jgi:hypothetical protein